MEEGSSGVDDGTTTTVEVCSTGVVLGADDVATTTLVVVGSSGGEVGAEEGLDETISGVILTDELDETDSEGMIGAAAEDERGVVAVPAGG